MLILNQNNLCIVRYKQGYIIEIVLVPVIFKRYVLVQYVVNVSDHNNHRDLGAWLTN